MLYITRKKNQTLIINHEIEISIVEIKGNQVKLGIKCNNTHSILRGEIIEKVIAENQNATKFDASNLNKLELNKFIK